MSIPVIGFFNNKGGVGKTSLVYHLSWMFSDSGMKVLAADLDPQSNLTAAFIDEETLATTLWHSERASTVYQCLEPLINGVGDIADPDYEIITDNLALVPGDMRLSRFEDELAQDWPKCLDGRERSFRVVSALWRITQNAARRFGAKSIVVDVGPNLGAINRAALIGCDFVVVPLGPDLFSLQGLENLGPALREWRQQWQDRLAKQPHNAVELPQGLIKTIGYMVIRHSIRLDRPVQAFDRWIAKIPATYENSVLGKTGVGVVGIEDDPNCIAKLKDYRSLMPLAQEARKPMFHLTPADGALGAHTQAVGNVREDFKNLAVEIARRAGLPEFRQA